MKHILKRVWLLLRREVFAQTQLWGIGAAVALILYVLSSLVRGASVLVMQVNGQSPQAGPAGASFFPFLLWIGGWLIASTSFQELGRLAAAERFLCLPASPLEKYLAKALVAFVALPVFVGLVVEICTLAGGLVSLAMSKHWVMPFNPFRRAVLDQLGVYYVGLSFFWLGSAFFRRYHFIKTLLCLGLYSFALNVTALVVGLFLFKDVGAVGFSQRIIPVLAALTGRPWPDGALSIRIVLICLAWALPAFSLVFGYVRLREFEARAALAS